MTDKIGRDRIAEIYKSLGVAVDSWVADGVLVTSPSDGQAIARLAADAATSIDAKVLAARGAQAAWGARRRKEREALIEHLAAAIKQYREPLAELITREAGKTNKEGLVEADGSVTVLLNTIRDASLPELSGMLREKERAPVGVVGLITSFNFPLVVGFWTLAPALLAGNAVVWKPSEKTPLVALAAKEIFDHAMGMHKDLLQVVIGGGEVGAALVAHEQVSLVSATGSVGMGKAISATLSKKKNRGQHPILELGGNNGVIISEHMSDEHLEWSLTCLLNSYLGTAGQRCTNTRRLIAHKSIYNKTVEILEKKIENFVAAGVIVNPIGGASNDYGYGALIDEDAYKRFEQAKKEAAAEGGKIVLGARLLAREYPNAFYVEPALALMPKQTAIMHKETFAPVLFIAPYNTFEEALAMVNAPANAGLVAGIYTQSQEEADDFAAACQAGHALINSPKGTGTPAHGMGFGGNKDSGCGEILNSADPLAAFTKPDTYRRIAQNKDIIMSA